MSNCLKYKALHDQPRVVPEKVERMKQLRNEYMGKSSTNRIIPKFENRKPKQQELDSVAICMQGNGDFDIDHTIGKSIPKVPNPELKKDTSRVFGLTTNQLNSRDQKDSEDTKTTFETVVPSNLQKNGLNEDDYFQQRGKEEIKDLLESINVFYKFSKFEAIWQKALSYEPDINTNPFKKTISLYSLMKAIREVESY